VSDNELGAFLRARREGLTPAEAGLPAGLEQGRDRHPSAAVLSALAGTLRLRTSERVHLYRLAKGMDPGFTCRGDATPSRAVRPAVRRMLELLEPAASVLLNGLTDLLDWTAGYERLMEPTGLLRGAPPNLARYVFTDPRARATFADWDQVADQQVAALKRGPSGRIGTSRRSPTSGRLVRSGPRALGVVS
jgi:hypothetical protein